MNRYSACRFLVIRSALAHFPDVFSKSSTGVVVPLYISPGSSWQVVIQAKRSHPSVPIVTIINPDSGPGTLSDANYATEIKKLQTAGVTVLGYVFTNYASRSQDLVIQDIIAYKNWYDVDGIMFDEMSNVLGNEDYYSSLTRYVKSIHMVMTVGNPGTAVPPTYFGTMDVLNIYEGLGIPDTYTLSKRSVDYQKWGRENFSIVAYGVKDLDESALEKASKHVAYLYLTDDDLPNPYDKLPSYFSSLMAALDYGNRSSSLRQTISTNRLIRRFGLRSSHQ